MSNPIKNNDSSDPVSIYVEAESSLFLRGIEKLSWGMCILIVLLISAIPLSGLGYLFSICHGWLNIIPILSAVGLYKLGVFLFRETFQYAGRNYCDESIQLNREVFRYCLNRQKETELSEEYPVANIVRLVWSRRNEHDNDSAEDWLHIHFVDGTKKEIRLVSAFVQKHILVFTRKANSLLANRIDQLHSQRPAEDALDPLIFEQGEMGSSLWLLPLDRPDLVSEEKNPPSELWTKTWKKSDRNEYRTTMEQYDRRVVPGNSTVVYQRRFRRAKFACFLITMIFMVLTVPYANLFFKQDISLDHYYKNGFGQALCSWLVLLPWFVTALGTWVAFRPSCFRCRYYFEGNCLISEYYCYCFRWRSKKILNNIACLAIAIEYGRQYRLIIRDTKANKLVTVSGLDRETAVWLCNEWAVRFLENKKKDSR